MLKPYEIKKIRFAMFAVCAFFVLNKLVDAYYINDHKSIIIDEENYYIVKNSDNIIMADFLSNEEIDQETEI